jgi:N-acetylglucosamine-6-phosphate deacetylase
LSRFRIKIVAAVVNAFADRVARRDRLLRAIDDRIVCGPERSDLAMSINRVFIGDLILPDRVLRDGALVCRDGRIVDIRAADHARRDFEVVNCAGRYLSPGFVDIHVHGGANADYMDGSVEAAIAVNRAHARHGTTTIFPTTTTGSRAQLEAMIAACEAAREAWTPKDGARIGGVHFYGPYFAPDKVGVHSPSGRRDPEREEYEFFLNRDIVRIATCAAELPGAGDFYTFAHQRGCFITCGHSNADWSELERAFANGMRHVDHFWCAMSSVASLRGRFGTPMRAGMEQYVLWNKSMSTEVIADGEHLSDELLKFAYDMIGPERLCLVTDANRAMDAPPGRYRFGPLEDGTPVISDGRTVRGEDGSLASSMCGMDVMVRTMLRATGAPLPKVIEMASLTPARLSGVSESCGSLDIGKRADFLVLSRDVEVETVYIAGERL